MKTGVLLAGGTGTRLEVPYNKHLALVYDRPMIMYPLDTLKQMGCDSAVIVSDPEGLGEIARLLKDGSDVGLELTYKVQPQPDGTAQALGYAEGHVKGVFPVLCADTFYDPAPAPQRQPTLYWHEFEGAANHTVWDPETNVLVEKPVRDIGRRAIVAYWFDERVFDVIANMQPGPNGELELIELYKYYLENALDLKMEEYKGFFGDMGTPAGLLRVANHLKEAANAAY